MKKQHVVLALASAALVVGGFAASAAQAQKHTVTIPSTLGNLHQRYPRANFEVANLSTSAEGPAICNASGASGNAMHGSYTKYFASRLVYWLKRAGMYHATGGTLISGAVKKIGYDSSQGALSIKVHLSVGNLPVTLQQNYNMMGTAASMSSCQSFLTGYRAAVDQLILHLLRSNQFESAMKTTAHATTRLPSG